MNLDEMIIAAFCEIDDAMNELLCRLPKGRLRSRGPQPRLHDSEVLTMEVIGAYLGLECDHAIYRFFTRHYAHFFPVLAKVHRTTFTRQAANLSHCKEHLWQRWLLDTPHESEFGLLDSLPLPMCRFARATFCRRFRFEDVQGLCATYGYDHVARQTFWGLSLLGLETARSCRLARSHHEIEPGSGSRVGRGSGSSAVKPQNGTGAWRPQLSLAPTSAGTGSPNSHAQTARALQKQKARPATQTKSCHLALALSHRDRLQPALHPLSMQARLRARRLASHQSTATCRALPHTVLPTQHPTRKPTTPIRKTRNINLHIALITSSELLDETIAFVIAREQSDCGNLSCDQIAAIAALFRNDTRRHRTQL